MSWCLLRGKALVENQLLKDKLQLPQIFEDNSKVISWEHGKKKIVGTYLSYCSIQRRKTLKAYEVHFTSYNTRSGVIAPFLELL